MHLRQPPTGSQGLLFYRQLDLKLHLPGPFAGIELHVPQPHFLQCGRFQPIEDFDESKRTCRRKVGGKNGWFLW